MFYRSERRKQRSVMPLCFGALFSLLTPVINCGEVVPEGQEVRESHYAVGQRAEGQYGRGVPPSLEFWRTLRSA